jgi:hypothetical protein
VYLAFLLLGKALRALLEILEIPGILAARVTRATQETLALVVRVEWQVLLGEFFTTIHVR